MRHPLPLLPARYASRLGRVHPSTGIPPNCCQSLSLPQLLPSARESGVAGGLLRQTVPLRGTVGTGGRF